MLDRRTRRLGYPLMLASLFLAAAPSVLNAQQAARPLTNNDVIRMVQDGVPESVIVSSIKSRPSNFDLSADGLNRLHTAKVPKQVVDTMMAAGAKPAAPTAAAPTSPQKESELPQAAVQNQQGGMPQEMDLEKAQLVETKTKPSSLAGLAADSAVTRAIQKQAKAAASGSSAKETGSSSDMATAHREATVTYVWGVPGPESSNALPTETFTPKFLVDFSDMRGVNPQDFEPAIVKLTPAQNICRIIGAAEGKEGARSNQAADWKIYSSFLEERVAVNLEKIAPGRYDLSPKSALPPGEYGLVLRPVSKLKMFSGKDVALARGEGFMFDVVWSFQVTTNGKPQ